MPLAKVLVTGDRGFLQRHQALFQALAPHVESLTYLPDNSPYAAGTSQKTLKLLYGLRYLLSPQGNFLSLRNVQGFRTGAKVFQARSQQAERNLRALDDTPDLIFHVFCMYSPLWETFDIPYVMYLDYTTALARQNWAAWVPFATAAAYAARLDCERLTYAQATAIFTMSQLVKDSLIADYGVEPRKITVVGSSSHSLDLYSGEKHFGSQQILFNGSDFERKGGDLVLEAFQQVREALPEATLVIIGKTLKQAGAGIRNLGYVSSIAAMRELFLHSDLVVAPSRCDPFPTFLLEAMSYGVPCVASAQDGIPEMIDHQINGITIPQPTPASLAQAMITLLADRPTLAAMSTQARLKIQAKLNWDSIADRIVTVLQHKP